MFNHSCSLSLKIHLNYQLVFLLKQVDIWELSSTYCHMSSSTCCLLLFVDFPDSAGVVILRITLVMAWWHEPPNLLFRVSRVKGDHGCISSFQFIFLEIIQRMKVWCGWNSGKLGFIVSVQRQFIFMLERCGNSFNKIRLHSSWSVWLVQFEVVFIQ